jgi:FAD/FMN-containing dehydrogenase
MAGTATEAGSALDDLRGQVRGEVFAEGDPAYAEACRIWNGMIDRRPAVVVRCTGSADVMAAVRFAREAGLAVSVRSGGHNVAGTSLSDGGLVVDLTGMRNVFVDRDRRTVRAAGGARLGDVDHETQAFALATPFGVVSKTGIAGLTLNGGMGFLTRRLGLSCDNLVGADVVTASGELVHADLERNSDLLWALRGGGGSFGVATSLEYRLHDVGPEVFMAIAFYPAEAGKEGLLAWREIMRDAPNELMSVALYWSAPPDEPFPPEWHGKPVFIMAGCWSGPLDHAEEAVRPLRELAEPIADLSGPMPFEMAQQLFDAEYPDGRRYYWKSAYLSDIDEVLPEICDRATVGRPSPLSSIDVWALGGAMRDEPEGGSAFAQREAPFLFGIEANWEAPDDDAANLAWARDLFAEAKELSPGGTYLNFPGFAEEGEELLRDSYGASYERLKEVKAKYDPENVFRGSFSIPVSR